MDKLNMACMYGGTLCNFRKEEILIYVKIWMKVEGNYVK
jgi:hypothetical protein